MAQAPTPEAMKLAAEICRRLSDVPTEASALTDREKQAVREVMASEHQTVYGVAHKLYELLAASEASGQPSAGLDDLLSEVQRVLRNGYDDALSNRVAAYRDAHTLKQPSEAPAAPTRGTCATCRKDVPAMSCMANVRRPLLYKSTELPFGCNRYEPALPSPPAPKRTER